MTEEKSASNNWKDRLEDATNLPGYVLPDKQAAWEKLHAQLHEKKAGDKYVWYWAAAACLLIVFSVVFIKTGKENNVVVVTTTTESQPEKIIAKLQLAIKENTEANNNIIAVEKNKLAVAVIKKPAATIIIKAEEKVNDSVLQPPVAVQEMPATIAVIEDSTIQAITAVVPLQKKMKVVHINELDNDGTINMVQTRKQLPSRIKFLNQDIYTDYTVKPSNTGFNILKLHSTPSN